MSPRTLVIDASARGSLENSTRSAVTAATEIGGPVDILVLGPRDHTREQLLRQITVVSRILVLEVEGDSPLMAEDLAPVLLDQLDGYSHLLAASTSFGKDLLPRLAALADIQMVSEVVAIEGPDTFVRPIYAGNALATVRVRQPRQILSIRSTAFKACALTGGDSTLERLPSLRPRYRTRQTGLRLMEQNDRPTLESASTVISGGKALGSGENFRILESLAAELGAAIGASRAAVDLGFVPNDLQVGQTGKVVAPDLYIAVGISGAIQHLAGMLESRVIVAINKDPDAPIFKVADYGLVGDLFEVVPELTRRIAALRAESVFGASPV
jgi:electron transfer flavoprotein alpha subunit